MKPIRIIIVCSILAIIISLIYFLYQSSTEMESSPKDLPTKHHKEYFTLRHLDVFKYNIPPYKYDDKSSVFKTMELNIADNCKINALYHLNNNSENDVPVLIFLHGRSFSSKIWLETGILPTFSNLGFDIFALDLPGFGMSKCLPKDYPFSNRLKEALTRNYKNETSPSSLYNSKSYAEIKNAILLDQIVKTIGLNYGHTKKFVLISPSMSGSYSIPYLMYYTDINFSHEIFDDNDNNEHTYKPKNDKRFHTSTDAEANSMEMIGYAPIAPTNFDSFDFNDYKRLRIPTLITYGESDVRLGMESLRFLEQIPTSVIVPIPNAGHACYIDQTGIWSQVFYNFLLAIVPSHLSSIIIGNNSHSSSQSISEPTIPIKGSVVPT